MKYEGEWLDDKRSGQATFTWLDGMKYVGEWLDGKRSGYGTQYDHKGIVISQGVWALDKFIKTAKVHNILNFR